MERSSPLAAMQPPSLPFGPGRWSFSNVQQRCGAFLGIPGNNFDFKELSMHRQRPTSTDYFNVKPNRNSSPAANLAIDLSQNLHVDQSPHVPTPRRSLFTTTVIGAFNGQDLETPPLPESSPTEPMDASPLPHKPAFGMPTRVTIQSPTPEPTPNLDEMLTSPYAIPESPSEIAKAPERRRPPPLRPSLTRSKGYTTTSVPLKTASLVPDRPPPFRFGNGYWTTSSSTLSLEECFVESPPREGPIPNASTINTNGPQRPRSSGHRNSVASQASGSPLTITYIRKPANSYRRPHKSMRRSLSMGGLPADPLLDRTPEPRIECGAPVGMDTFEPPTLQLPCVMNDGEYIPRISGDTMVQVLGGAYDERYDRRLIIDCRFEYEFNGGHIDGAVNHNDKEQLVHDLFSQPSSQKTLLIFHCEYSAHRAPITAKHIREADRIANVHQYPLLSYPEIYILDGGYSAFFKNYKQLCFPQNYIEMNAKEHEHACERGLGRIKQSRAKLSRAQTFAFGQQIDTIDESPTAAVRTAPKLVHSMSMDICMEEPPVPKLDFAARRIQSL